MGLETRANTASCLSCFYLGLSIVASFYYLTGWTFCGLKGHLSLLQVLPPSSKNGVLTGAQLSFKCDTGFASQILSSTLHVGMILSYTFMKSSIVIWRALFVWTPESWNNDTWLPAFYLAYKTSCVLQAIQG